MATELRFQVPVLRRNMAAMLALADTTINTVRRIASELRPSVLDDLGLVVAIKWQAQQFQDRTGIMYDSQWFALDVHSKRQLIKTPCELEELSC